ncbi:MAG TPA: sugar phosphate nucleotidyltransferase [Terriglobales bacterium]|nr:sugar phosphate nucleotidyltransferase [Terriglobales bacterium]
MPSRLPAGGRRYVLRATLVFFVASFFAVQKTNFYPVILAGGSGTRFWPRSRRRRAKQVLALDGKHTMIQQTFARLAPLARRQRFWVITNRELQGEIARQLPQLQRAQIVAEPAARNTAPAIGLAAFLLRRLDPQAVLGMFPADHVIAGARRFRHTLARAIALAAAGPNLVVMGVPPSRPETGYGYIEAGERTGDAYRVRRFTEKPSRARAEKFLATGRYYWNSGMFVWSAETLAAALAQHLPRTANLLEEIAAAWGTRRFAAVFRRLYPRCENLSVDYGVLEPRSAQGERGSRIYCLPADFGWSDLGSWAALHEHHAASDAARNVIEAAGCFTLDAAGNYIYSPKKFVAAVGIRDAVVVETEDALLVTTRAHAQEVGKVVKHLRATKLEKLL